MHHLRNLVDSGDAAAAAEMTVALTPSELADLLLRLGPTELARLEPYVGSERLADAVAELDATEAARLIVRFSRAEAADILEEMEPDDATDIVDELAEPTARGILAEMRAEDAAEIRELLNFPPHTAGGRMTPEFISISPNVSVAAALRLLRAAAPSAETIYYIYVTDRAGELVGVVSLRDLIISDPQRQIRDIMRRQVIRVPVDEDQEIVARLLTEHDFIAMPVVDGAGRLVGVVTADDVSDVLEEEATEDIERLGGSQPLVVPYLRAPLRDLFKKRIGWLLILFVAGTYTSFVLQTFSDTLSHLVALTFFIPLLVGTGGNVGSQIVTTVVRALAVGDVSLADARRVIGRELAVSLGIGLVMAAIFFIRAETMDVGLDVAKVVAISAAFIVTWSALISAGLPLILQRLRLDPAVVSAPLMSTFVDGTGLIMYLGMAHLLLGL